MSFVENVLKNSNGLVVRTIPIGATVNSVQLPNGRQIVLGYRDLEVYRVNSAYFGCAVGRCTNRTAGAKFSIDGKEYKISENVPPHHLHGGEEGFSKRMWSVENATNTSVTYKLVSPDGDQGYPGNLTTVATYTINDSNQLVIEYFATTDAPTAVNLTNHAYFNLAGNGEPIMDHTLQLNAETYTKVDGLSIPTGEIASVRDTVMDFLQPHKIGERYQQVPGSTVGYDHNYCLNSEPKLESDKSLHLAGRLEDPSTKTSLIVYTNQPCVQLYMGGYLDLLGESIEGLDGHPFKKYSGVCLETQMHPNAINQANFPSTILRPGQNYYSKTVWEFSWA